MSYNYDQPPPPPPGYGRCTTQLNPQQYEIVDSHGNIIIKYTGPLSTVNQNCIKQCMNQYTYTVKNYEGITMKAYDVEAIKNNCF
jgi:hypothetical protein